MKRGLLLSLLLSAAMLLSACGADTPVDDAQTVLPDDTEQTDTNAQTYTPEDETQENEITYLDDVLGFSGYAVTAESMDGDFWKIVDYYAIIDGEEVAVAESFGFGDTAYSKTVAYDLDGDGRSELVSFCVYGGDGAERVYAFRWNGTASEKGTPDWSRADIDLDEIDWGYIESYDTERGVIALCYHGDWESDEYRTVELPLTMESFLWEAYEINEG